MKRRECEPVVAQPDPPSPENWNPENLDHDDSLILWMLELSPTKRLAVAQGFVDSVRELRSADAFRFLNILSVLVRHEA